MKHAPKLLIAAVLAAASLTATAKISDGKAYGDWKGICQEGECGVGQIVNNDKGEPVGRIVLRKVPEAKNNVVAFITIPLGVNLRAGMALAVDGKELGVSPYDFCDPNGCTAVIPLEGDVLKKIKAGSALQVGSYFGNKQQTMGFSLKGVTAAIKEL